MVIDFHTHTFPDKIAAKTIALLEKKGYDESFRDGSVSSLLGCMKRAGVDISVSLPVATKVSQVESINRMSKELNGKDGLIFAGAIHPDCENIEEILDDIKDSGLYGIKLHSDYQDLFFDEDRCIRIIKGAAERDLMITAHAGFDPAYPNEVHCTVDMIVNVLDKVGSILDDKLILAHMGSVDKPDEVIEKLIGRKVYFDTAYVLDKFPDACVKIIKRHGADRVLFASDSPWSNQKKYVELLKSLDLSDTEKELILYKNAQRILRAHGQNV